MFYSALLLNRLLQPATNKTNENSEESLVREEGRPERRRDRRRGDRGVQQKIEAILLTFSVTSAFGSRFPQRRMSQFVPPRLPACSRLTVADASAAESTSYDRRRLHTGRRRPPRVAFLGSPPEASSSALASARCASLLLPRPPPRAGRGFLALLVLGRRRGGERRLENS